MKPAIAIPRTAGVLRVQTGRVSSTPATSPAARAKLAAEAELELELELEQLRAKGVDVVDPKRAPHMATRKLVDEDGQTAARNIYDAFEVFNRRHFGGKLAQAMILITEPSSHRSLGDYCPKDVHGIESRIRIAPRAVRRGENFTLDVLLHEMVHAWQKEIDGDEENGWRGHGPRFATKCNEIGKTLGLEPVAAKGRHGLPDCAHWPQNVRPAGYYPEPYEPSRRRPKAPAADVDEDLEADPDDEDSNGAGAIARTDKRTILLRLEDLRKAIRTMNDPELSELVAMVQIEVSRRARPPKRDRSL